MNKESGSSIRDRSMLGLLPMAFFLCLSSASAMLSGCNMATGEKALEKMTPEEKAIVDDTLMKIEKSTTRKELVELLGEPDRNGFGMRPTWLGPDEDPTSQIAIYFVGNDIVKIRWIKLGYFTWERRLK